MIGRTGLWLCAWGLALSGCDPRAKDDVPPKPEGFIEKGEFIGLHAELQLLEAAHRQHMLKGDRDRTRALHRTTHKQGDFQDFGNGGGRMRGQTHLGALSNLVT